MQILDRKGDQKWTTVKRKRRKEEKEERKRGRKRETREERNEELKKKRERYVIYGTGGNFAAGAGMEKLPDWAMVDRQGDR